MRCKILCRYFVIALILPFQWLAPPPLEAKAASPIFISEVAWAGSTLSTADEWIELGNATDQDVSVGGWRLVGAGESGRDIVLPVDAIIPANGTFIVSNYAQTDAKCALLNKPDVVTTTVSLSNSTLLIKLLNQDRVQVDQAGNGKTPLAGYSSTDKASMERVDPLISGDDATAWVTSNQTVNIKSQDKGTPGVITAILPANVEPVIEPIDELPVAEELTAVTNPEITPENTATSTTVILPESLDVATNPSNLNLCSAVYPCASPTTTVSSTNATTAISAGDSASASATAIADTILASSTANVAANAIADSAETTGVYSTANASSTETTTANATGTTAITTFADNVSIQTTISASPSLQSNQSFLRLNEVMPNPASGKEWVEIVSTAPDRTIQLDGMRLYNKRGSIKILQGSLTSETQFLVIELSSGRLTNAGDIIRLVDSTGQTIDTLTYIESHKGASWARDNQGAWRETYLPTPGSINTILDTAPVVAKTTNSKQQTTKTSTAKTISSTVMLSATSTKASKTVKTTSSTKVKTELKTKIASTTKSSIAKTTAKTTATKAKTTTKTASPVIIKSITLDMLDELTEGGIRVVLNGLVGTQPKLLPGRTFILLNEQGRGLSVHVPNNKKLPPLGISVRVTGTLKFDANELPYLLLGKNDDWNTLEISQIKNLKAAASTQPRDVAFYAPSNEDAWGLVQASGTVAAVSGQTITLATDQGDVDIKVRPVISYRAGRLKAGDKINVMGILALGSDRPFIYPRSADEIVLNAHAVIAQMTTAPAAQSGLPGWTPLCAAAAVIGAIQGVKTVRKRKTVSVKTGTVREKIEASARISA